MASLKQNIKQVDQSATGSNAMWRKPISLTEYEDEDPLEMLYRGREENPSVLAVKIAEANENIAESAKKAKDLQRVAKPKKLLARATKKPDKTDEKEGETAEILENSSAPQSLTEDELKKILKIKSAFFRFTDIREILRGKSFDIYSYLRLLAGDEGVCKIKHLDLMSRLDVSRPTLFKQEEWLVRLRLIEKRNVPGDHLGTSYTVHRLEDVLPVPKNLMKQLNSHIENLHKTVS